MEADIAEGRRAVRHFASGVAVLTTVTGDGVVHGTTVSAVTAISRDPLLIGVCLRARSSFVSRLAAHDGRFVVNVLRAGQHEVARSFADPRRPAGAAQFAAVRWCRDAHSGAPLITDALAHFSCRTRDRLSLGDHDLVVADVLDGAAQPGPPLLSFGGRLHDAAPAGPSLPETALTARSAR